MENKPEKLQRFMKALMKEASRTSFVDLMYYWDISDEEEEEIEKWFKEELGINLW